MSARYRIKEHKSTFTPQKRLLGVWWRIARPQPTMQAASEIIRQKLKAEQPSTPERSR
jgi:Tfp pilus assembly protein PilF